MYWDLGLSILERQSNEGWGAKIIGRLSYALNFCRDKMANAYFLRTFTEKGVQILRRLRF
jgi:hypothetical protein